MLFGATQVEVPVGHKCLVCVEPIALGDRGLIRATINSDGRGLAAPVHAECEALGIVGHLFGVCHCTGYDTRSRAAARELWQRIPRSRSL